MSFLDESLDADVTDENALRDLDKSIRVEADPAKRASLFERQNEQLKSALGAQKQRLRDIKEQELDLASSDLARLQERMEQLAAENRELEQAVGHQPIANGGSSKARTTLPVTDGAPREASRSVLEVLASESAAYVKKLEGLESGAAQVIQRLRMHEEEEAEARRQKQVEALLQENRAFAARIEKFEETTVTTMQREIDALKAEVAAVHKQIPPNISHGAQQAVTAFVDKYSPVMRQMKESTLRGDEAEERKKLRGELESYAQLNSELEAQCRRRAAEAEEQARVRAELEAQCRRYEMEAEEQVRVCAELQARLKRHAEEEGEEQRGLRSELETQARQLNDEIQMQLKLHAEATEEHRAREAQVRQAMEEESSQHARVVQQLEMQLQAQTTEAKERATQLGELEAQCEQSRNAAAGHEERIITLAAVLKASQLEVDQLRAELAARIAVAVHTASEPMAVSRDASLALPVVSISAQQSTSSDGPSSVVHLRDQAETTADTVTALPVVPVDSEEHERVEIQLRSLRTALLGLEAENGGLTQDNHRLHNEVAILAAENKRLFEESQLGSSVREEMQALHQLLTETAVQRADLTRFLQDPERGALDEAFMAMLRLIDEYEKYVEGRTGHVSDGSQPKSAAALAERHAEELRGLWHHVSSSNRNLLRLLTQQTAEAKSLQEQVQAFRIRNHMLVDSSNGLKSALARAATELEEWHNRALSWERERAGLQADRNHWMSLVYAQAKEDLEEHRALLGLASSSASVVGS